MAPVGDTERTVVAIVSGVTNGTEQQWLAYLVKRLRVIYGDTISVELAQREPNGMAP